jgi:hypothetical protein
VWKYLRVLLVIPCAQLAEVFGHDWRCWLRPRNYSVVIENVRFALQSADQL